MTAPAQGPVPRLLTERLVVRPATEADIPAVVRYYIENRAHLGRFEPERTASFYTEEFWQARVRLDRQELLQDRALRLFLFPRSHPERVIGVTNFTQVVRGVAHACTLGYGIARDQQGKGLMREALSAAISYVFGPMRLHRVEAAYMPHNRRSGALLRRLGFAVEGYARDYLLINGQWEDHVLASLTNHGWSHTP